MIQASPSAPITTGSINKPIERGVSVTHDAQESASAVSKPAKRSQQGFTIFHGMNWSAWKQTRRTLVGSSRGYGLRRAAVTALSAVNSMNEWLEDAVFGCQIDATTIVEPPIFILGHWRSGTTLLHDLLALDPQLAFPNLYQVMFPGHFMLTEKWITRLTGRLLPKVRPMDNMAVRWNGSQEDEIALLIRTQISPYNMLFSQGAPERYRRFFDLTEISSDELTLWKHEFVRFLKKLTLRSRKPLVLKSPSHTCRIPLLLELFPTARFVYLHRDPYAVYSSSMHLRKALFAENALSAPNFDGLEDDTLWTYNHTIARYEATKHLIPPHRLHEIRFEDLEADPLRQVRNIYQTLALPDWPQVEPKIVAELPRLAAYKKNAFSLDPATMQRVYDTCRFAFDVYGYPSRLGRSDASRSVNSPPVNRLRLHHVTD